MQEKSEQYLDNILIENWLIWQERSNLRGLIFNSLYKFRNLVFGINPSSTRKKIPGNYAINIESLESILLLANKLKINVLLYVVPLRNDFKIPYDEDEYELFKEELKSLSDMYNTYYINLENLIPPEFWGMKESTSITDEQELDFMHFQESGHRLLAGAIFDKLQKIWQLRDNN